MGLKVLIVDDEPLICRGLRAMIPWQQLDLELSGTASNGEEAFRIIRETKPDLVITDIRMPVMDGLELIANCSKAKLSLHFILLTGYKEFEYAKKAMYYGVKQYILKPTDPELLQKALEEESREILSEQKERQENSRLRLSYEKVRDKAAEQYWYECLKFGKCFDAGLSLYVPTERQGRECLCAAVYIEEKSVYFERFILKQLCYEVLSPHFKVCCASMEKNLALIVEHRADEKLLALLQQIRELFYAYIKKNVIFSLSPKGTYHMIPRLYERAAVNFKKNFLGNGEDILLPGTKQHPGKARSAGPDLSHYKSQLAGGSAEMMKDLVAAFLEELKESHSTVEEAKQQLLKLYLMVKNYLNLNAGDIDIFDVDYIIQANSFRVVEKIFQDIFHEYETSKSSGISVQQRTIERMKLLAQEHISEEDLSLKWLAKNYLYMNEEYLGKLFTQYTGMRFSAYAAGLRIQTAKMLLDERPEIKISDLCQQIGFGRNAAYFSTVFKAHTGVSPREYKERG